MTLHACFVRSGGSSSSGSATDSGQAATSGAGKRTKMMASAGRLTGERHEKLAMLFLVFLAVSVCACINLLGHAVTSIYKLFFIAVTMLGVLLLLLHQLKFFKRLLQTSVFWQSGVYFLAAVLASVLMGLANESVEIRTMGIYGVLWRQYLPHFEKASVPSQLVVVLLTLYEGALLYNVSSDHAVTAAVMLASMLASGVCSLSLRRQSRCMDLVDNLLKALLKESEISFDLVDRLCDAHLWLSVPAADGITDASEVRLSKSTGSFDALVGCAMEGEDLLSCMDHESRQADASKALVKALARAGASSSAQMRTKFLSKSLEAHDVELLIFDQSRHDAMLATTGNKAVWHGDFLVGVRLVAENEFESKDVFTISLNSDAKEHADGVAAPKAGGLLVPRHLGSQDNDFVSVASTTPTGRVFADFYRLLENDPEEVKRRLETIAELGLKERWLLSVDQLRLQPDDILGCGGFGVVVGAVLHGMDVAVKVARTSKHGTCVRHLANLSNELRILRQLRHPNVVLFHGACIDPSNGELALVLERVRGIRLDEYVHDLPLTEFGMERRQILNDICCAVRYLHAQSPRVVHGDLTGSNIFVEPMPRAKLLDFGLSRLLTRRARPLGGTLVWMAPEVIRTPLGLPQPSADVFSLGRLAYLVVTSKMPLRHVRHSTIVKMAKLGHQQELVWPDMACAFLEECKVLCDRCLQVEAADRPDIAAVHTDVLSWCANTSANNDNGMEAKDDEAVDVLADHWRKGLRQVRECLSTLQGDAAGGRRIPSEAGAAAPPQPKGPTPLPRGDDSPKPGKDEVHGGGKSSEGSGEGEPRSSSSARHRKSGRLTPTPALGVGGAAWPGTLHNNSHGLTGTGTALSPVPEHSDPTTSGPMESKTKRKPSDTRSQLVRPECTPTTAATQMRMVMDMLQRWNFSVPHGSCCRLHAAVKNLEAVLGDMRPCFHTFEPLSGVQCGHCGVLMSDKMKVQVCEHCGNQLATSSQPPPRTTGQEIQTLAL
eukprot:TRINITY_DN18397_c0_g1_i1.p1 TRINITY_DN18397_c0_g1~~TRINITY_DN18397_c0_g1_i1.p1  ORF type:complete len:1000 (+),score=179.49 TRINITY_DN18397_c0_g1_i1:96-3095(+)